VVELYPEARKVLEAARDARTPSRADRERVFASLMASVAVGGAATPMAAAAKTSLLGKLASQSALWVKAAVSVAVVSTAGVSAYAYVRHRAHPPTVAAPGAVHVSTPAGLAVAAAPVVPDPPPVASEPAAPVASTLPNVGHAAPTPARQPSDGLSAELSLLRRAHEARRAGQPERTLELVREHVKKYPHSQMWAERETLRVLALCDLGRVDAARRSAAPLEYLWSSPLRATLNASCVGK
jgi:hypothetical protein